jgi:hypothetical protein
MDAVLSKLERTFGRLAIERFGSILVAGMGVVFLMRMMQPAWAAKLLLVPELVPREPWRLLSFVFYPPEGSPFFAIFTLMFAYWVLNGLEASWGAFKLNVFYLVGVLGCIAAAFVSGRPQTNYFLHESMFLALATLGPNVEIQLMFLPIPIKMKYLAGVAMVFIGWQFMNGDMGERIGIVFSLGNYLLFFTGYLVELVSGRSLAAKQAKRRVVEAKVAKQTGRACAICGAKQDDGADIRVCSCEKCGGKPRDLCLAHAREH